MCVCVCLFVCVVVCVWLCPPFLCVLALYLGRVVFRRSHRAVVSTRLVLRWRLFAHPTDNRPGQSVAAAGGDSVDVQPPRLQPASRSASLSFCSAVGSSFHQFFQSSIDSGLCISEARVLWRWPRRCADRKTLSHDSAVHGNTKQRACRQSLLF